MITTTSYQIRELNVDELSRVSGGGFISFVLNIVEPPLGGVYQKLGGPEPTLGKDAF
jgi:hypothetical protein